MTRRDAFCKIVEYFQVHGRAFKTTIKMSDAMVYHYMFAYFTEESRHPEPLRIYIDQFCVGHRLQRCDMWTEQQYCTPYLAATFQKITLLFDGIPLTTHVNLGPHNWQIMCLHESTHSYKQGVSPI